MLSCRLLVVVLSWLLFFGTLPSNLYGGDRRAEYLDMRRLIGQEKFHEAIVSCKQLLEKYPDYVYLYETLPEVAQYSGDLADAAKFFEARIEDGREIGLAYFGLGTTYYHMKDYKSAVLCLNKAVDLGVSAPECYRTFEYAYEKLEGVEAAIRFFSWLSDRYPENANNRYAVALAFWSKHDYQKVLSKVDEAIAINRKERKYFEAKVVMQLLTARNMEAGYSIAKYIGSAELFGDLEGSQFLRSYLAIVHVHSNDWDSLITVASSIYHGAKQFGQYKWLGGASVRLALGFYCGGDCESSLRFTYRAVEAGERAGDKELVLAGLGWRFRNQMQLGKYEDAIKTAFERIQKSIAQSYDREYLSALSDLSWVYHELGEDSFAMDCAVEASSRAQGIGVDWDLLHQTQNTLGILYETKGSYRAAIRNFQYALSIVRNTNFQAGNSAASFGLLGNAYLNIGEFNNARIYFLRRLRCIQSIRLRCEEPSALADLAHYYFLKKQYKRSRSLYYQALESARRTGQMPVVQVAARGLAQVAESSNKLLDALYWYGETVKGSKLLAIANGAQYTGASSNFKNSGEFRDYARVLLDLNRFEDAFKALENAKLQATLNTIAIPWRKIAASLRDSSRSSFLQIKKSIERSCSALAAEFRQDAPMKNITRVLSLRNELLKLEIDYWALLDRDRSQSRPSLVSSLCEWSDLKQFRREYLSKGEALLEYFVDGRRTDAFLFTRDTLIHFIVNLTRNELSALLNKMSYAIDDGAERKYITNATLANFDLRVSETLYKLLISPIDSQLCGINRLIIAPDETLTRLPFEALISRSSNRESPEMPEAHYLIERCEIKYVPGSFFLRMPFRTANLSKKSILALGDPLEFVRQDSPSMESDKFARSHSIPLEAANLPGALSEVKRLREIFGNGVDVAVGDHATKSLFKQISSDYRILHIAAHSSFNDSNPLFSSIQLASDPGGIIGSGTLYAFEFLNLPLNADLVVLSGCKTGLGKSMQGMDGLVGALIGAGTTSVLSALWAVDDISTAELMNSFYKHLALGVRKSQALRLAKLELIKSGKRDPFYWGAFVLVGDCSGIEFRRIPNSTDWVWIGAGLSFLGAGVFIWIVRRRSVVTP